MEKVTIEIPKANENEIVNIPKGELGVLKDHFDKQFNKIDKLLFAIVTSVVVSVAAVVITAIGIFLDQMRYNNAVYGEYSQKVQSVETVQATNQSLLDQNKQNQQLIIDQQNQILEMLKKK
jgi:hypothetical protein